MIFKQPNLICSFSKRPRNMSLAFGDTKDSLENRKDFLNGLGIDYRQLVCAKQIHASRVEYVREGERGKGALSYNTAITDTDALITDKIGLPIAVFTADCLSVFLYDAVTSSIGLVHASWRSTKENIAAKTAILMQDKFNTNPRNLFVGLGPVIRECCYEVGEEFVDFFSFGLVKRQNRYYLDLVQINKRQLLGLGVQEVNIYDSRICTSCKNEDFFSYRKEGSNCGRMMSVMMLNSHR